MAGGRCLQSSRFEVVPVLPKINSNGFGGKVIAVGILVGAVIPLILWVAMHRIIWPLVIVGATIIVVFCALLAIVPVFLYNGELGRPVKSAFYLIYPIHLAVLGVLTVHFTLA